MEDMPLKFWIALALAALSAGETRSQDLEMRVEEPALASPPIDPGEDADRWKGAAGKPGLSKAQKKAYLERRRQVEAMATEVREKREALLHSTDAERAARAKDLEQLILDPALEPGKLEKLEKLREKQAEAQAKSLEMKMEIMENRSEKSMEKKQEKLDKEKEASDRP
jgi:hypothetical protein